MARDFFKTKFPGVFYRLTKNAEDRIYYVNYADLFGSRHWKCVGRHSEGMRPNTAALRRAAIMDENSTSVPQKPFTIGEAVEAYAKMASSAGKHVVPYLEQYARHCKKLCHNTPIDKFPPAKAEALKNRLLTSGLSAQSVFHALNFLRRVCNFAVTTRHASSNPFLVKKGGPFSMPKVENERLRFFSPREADRLLAALYERSPQLYQMSLLSLHTGLRATEIFGLRTQDIDFQAGCIHLISKGGRREKVHAPQHILAMLARIEAKKGDLLFADENGNRRHRIVATFSRIVASLGMQEAMGSPYRITFHTWRHTFGSWLAQSGKVTIHELMQLMRHRTISMTLRYAHLIPGDVSQKVSHIEAVLSSAALRDHC